MSWLMLAWAGVPIPVQALAAPQMPVHITWQAALAIALFYYLSQSAWLAGLGFWTLYRPLIGGTLVGVVLGDPAAGARIGAAINLAYLGFIATGGSLPADISLAGYLGTAVAMVNGVDEGTVLAATLPVGMLGYLIYQLRMNLDILFVHWADRYAARGDARGVALCNVVPAQTLLLLLSVLPCYVGVYYGPTLLSQLITRLPEWLLPGLSLAGGALPALGIAMSLHLLWRGVNGAYFVLGFVIASLAAPPILAFGLAATAIAIIHIRSAWGREGASSRREGEPAMQAEAPRAPGPLDVRAQPPPALRRRDLLASWLAWLFFSHASYNYERMQGLGFAHSMVPILRRLYPQREQLAAALQRHVVYYNAEPNIGAVVNGLVAALEEAHARGGEVGEAAITAAKAGLMGAASGLGDTLIQGTMAPVLLSLGIGMVRQGSLLGVLIYIIVLSTTIWGVGWGAYLQGYRGGRAQVAALLRRNGLREVAAAAEIVGSSILGALAAGAIHLRTAVVLPIGDSVFRVQEDLLDKVLPQALSLLLVMAYLALLRRRVSPGWLALGSLVVGLVARGLGVL